MDFKVATDALFSRVDHAAFAAQLRVSTALIRQARLKDGTAAHRAPPHGWKRAAIQIAMDRAAFFADLAEKLSSGVDS